MAKRVTIMLDDDLSKKLHDLQARLIKDSNESVSFSAVINNLLRKNMK
jgi:predicted CopG family antitoxin